MLPPISPSTEEKTENNKTEIACLKISLAATFGRAD